MSPLAIRVAAAPVAAALLALMLAFLTGFDQRSALPPELMARFYGFLLDRYPLFAFALVYGVARILAGSCVPGTASVVRRGLGALVGIALLLALSLHPTFGGIVLRGGFGSASLAFLNGVPMPTAYALGAVVAATPFGIAVGLALRLAGPPPGPRTGWLRAIGRGAGDAMLGLLAFWLGALLIGLAHDAGFGRWPRRPLDGRDAAVATALLLGAGLPHAALVAWRLCAVRGHGTKGERGLIEAPASA